MEEYQTEDLYPIRKNGKEGYIKKSGEIVIEPKYDYASVVSWGVAEVAITPEKNENNTVISIFEGVKDYVFPLWGFINKYGYLVSDFVFDHIPFHFSQNKEIVAAETRGKWGYIHHRFGESHGYWPSIVEVDYIVKPTFDDASDCFSEGLACVKKDGKWGFIKDDFLCGLQRAPIDKTDDYAIEPLFDDAHNFSEGLANVMIVDSDEVNNFQDSNSIVFHEFNPKPKTGKWGYIDKTGTFIIYPQFECAGSFSNGLAPVKKDGKWGFIDKQGDYIIKPQFDDASCFIEDLAHVKIDGKYGYIDKNGKYFIKPKFDSVEPFNDGIAIVKEDNKYYYISRDLRSNKFVRLFRSWKRISQTGFDQAKPFCYGLAVVCIDGKYGYISKKGKYIIKPIYDEAHSFLGDLAPIKQQKKFHYINKKGEIVWTSEEFPYIWFQNHELI